MSDPSARRRILSAMLAVVATLSAQSLWLGAMDRDAAAAIAAIPAYARGSRAAARRRARNDFPVRA